MGIRRIAVFAALLLSCATGVGQVSVAQSTPFTSATTKNTPETAFQIKNGSFIPFFAETKEPTVFDIPEEYKQYIAILTLPKGSAFGGIQFNTPGVKGWNFPKAESDITIVLGNNITPEGEVPQTRRVVVSVWKNPSKADGPPLAPVKAGTIYLDIIPDSLVPVPKPEPFPKPVPTPVPTPITYTGKKLLLMFEQSENATAQRGAFFQSKELREFLATVLKKAPDVIDVTTVPQSLKPYLALKPADSTFPYFFFVAADGPEAGRILKQGSIAPTVTPTDLINLLK